MATKTALAPPRPAGSAQPIMDPVRIKEIVSEWIDGVSELLKTTDQQTISGKDLEPKIRKLFLDNSYWRDLVCLSWDFRTLTSPKGIANYLAEENRLQHLKAVRLDDNPAHQPRDFPIHAALPPDGPIFGIIVFLELELSSDRIGTGMLQLGRDEDGSWKAYSFSTLLEEIKGYEAKCGPRRPENLRYGYEPGRRNFSEVRATEREMKDKEPAVVIVGAGHTGLTVAAHLTHMGIRALVIDKNPRVGDNWRQRYGKLVLHDPVYAESLPYMKYPETWPLFAPKEKMGDFLESYAKLLDLNVWTDSTLKSSDYDPSSKQWTVTIERGKAGGNAEIRTFRTNHIVAASGLDGKPRLPDIPGLASFKSKNGTGVIHSALAGEAAVAGPGEKIVVVGMGNSAIDIAQGSWENGAEVTMIQRGPSYFFRRDSLVKHGFMTAYWHKPLLPEHEMDMIMWAYPMPIRMTRGTSLAQAMFKEDEELLQKLKALGFQFTSGPNGTGLIGIVAERKHPYVNDTGCMTLVAEKKIALQTGPIERITENSIVMSNGTTLPADHIIMATGYQGAAAAVRDLMGEKVFSKLGKPFEYDEEGEWIGNWRPSGHERFWMCAAPLVFSRLPAKLLALQILGVELGLH
ncbi:hypothetical protein Trisim1_007775 [Trichoderma cf. simile WF8]